MNKKNLFIFISFILSFCLFTAIVILHFISRMNLPGFFGNLIPPEYVEFFIQILPGTIYTDVPLLYLFAIIVFGMCILIAPI
jgi:hypothetical protein